MYQTSSTKKDYPFDICINKKRRAKLYILYIIIILFADTKNYNPCQ